MMKILLLGKNGQVGWELQRSLALLGEVIALDRGPHVSLCGDLTNLDGLAQTIQLIKPDVVVNAAAYTAVDQAESDRVIAKHVNTDAVAVLAREVSALNAWFVHYSIDYVFDGSGSQAWRETDAVAPLNYYGQTKLEGELAIQASGCKHLIFRTSWVYGGMGNNFAKTMIKLATKQDTIRVISDQIGAPTGADLLADATAHAIRMAIHRPNVSGIYHLCPQEETSWYDYACFTIEQVRSLGQALSVQSILPISTHDYATDAKRPLNSRLNTTKFMDTFSLSLPHWQTGVSRMIKENWSDK